MGAEHRSIDPIDGLCITTFSCPNYCDSTGNKVSDVYIGLPALPLRVELTSRIACRPHTCVCKTTVNCPTTNSTRSGTQISNLWRTAEGSDRWACRWGWFCKDRGCYPASQKGIYSLYIMALPPACLVMSVVPDSDHKQVQRCEAKSAGHQSAAVGSLGDHQPLEGTLE